MNETTAAYRQMIADGHQPTAQDVTTLCDEVEALRARLEIQEDNPYDGIDSRDETIKILDERVEELRAELSNAREEEEQARRELEDERDRVNVQREDIRTLRMECDRIRAELETARAALVEQIEARQVTEAEGGALQQANNEIDRLQAELSLLRSAPVAVEVPELSQDSFRDCHAEDHFQEFDEATTIANINAWFRANIRAVHPSRILKDGERAVPVEEWDALEHLRCAAVEAMIEVRNQGECSMDGIDHSLRRIDALRSSKDSA